MPDGLFVIYRENPDENIITKMLEYDSEVKSKILCKIIGTIFNGLTS